jgi:alpha-beta hydrolase superfamily lysophospholipase
VNGFSSFPDRSPKSARLIKVRPQPGPVNKRSSVAGGLRMNVVEAGSGPDVVLLHGFANHSYSWRHRSAS